MDYRPDREGAERGTAGGAGAQTITGGGVVSAVAWVQC